MLDIYLVSKVPSLSVTFSLLFLLLSVNISFLFCLENLAVSNGDYLSKKQNTCAETVFGSRV